MGLKIEEERVVVRYTVFCDATGCGKGLATGTTLEDLKRNIPKDTVNFQFNRNHFNSASTRIYVCSQCYNLGFTD